MLFPLCAAVIALAACLVVGSTAAIVVRTTRPAQAVMLLTAASLAVSMASGIALTAIAIAVVASLTTVAAKGHWSAPMIRAEIPMPGWLGLVAGAAVALLLLRAVVRTVSIIAALVRADRFCRQIRPGTGGVVMVDDDSADAYTVAGLRGCVVISRRLFDELSTDERRVLTAHELSHLRKRHHLYVHLTDIAAAANPLLKQASAAVRLGVERWADEDAASGIGDRRITGRALARVALLRSRLAGESPSRFLDTFQRTIPVLGAGSLQVAVRVEALLQPVARPRFGRLAAAIVLSGAVLLVGLESLDQIQDAIAGSSHLLRNLHQR